MSADPAGCLGKRSFQTWAQAAMRCRALNRKKNRGGDHFEPYRCATGCGYHIGRTDPDEKRVNRQQRRKFYREEG